MQSALKQRLQSHAYARSFRSCRPAALARPSSLHARAAAATPIEVITSQYEKELKDAKEAVRLAARLCQVVQRQLSSEERADKKDDSPVTVADYGAQVLVAWSLQRAAPSSRLSMVAEEDSAELRAPEGRPMLLRITQLANEVLRQAVGPGEQVTPEDVLHLIDLGGSPGGPQGRHWVLDPIDGTRGFVGMRQYSVCLGMIQDGEVVLGVLGCPNLPQGQVCDEDGGSAAVQRSNDDDVGCLFSARRGHGAWAQALWDPAAPQQRITVDDSLTAAQSRFMESYESRHSSHSVTAAVAAELGVVLPPLRMDSQVKYGLLSRGCASIFMRFPPPTYKEKIWDHAAGFVIVEEAGGKVTDAAGTRLDFSAGRYLALDRGIIAAPPTLHKQLVAAAGKVTLGA